jgi:hypothetical protein
MPAQLILPAFTTMLFITMLATTMLGMVLLSERHLVLMI